MSLMEKRSSFPNAEGLVELLNREIEDVKATEDRSGWTLWAIAGALGAVALLLLGLWENGEFSLYQVAKWLVVLAVPVDALVGWLWTWSTHNPIDRGRRYRYFREFEHLRLAMLWRAVHAVLLVSIAIYASSSVPFAAVVFTVGWYVLIALVSFVLVGFATPALDLPYEETRTPGPVATIIVGAGFSLLLGYAVFAYSRTIPLFIPGSNTTELRIAALALLASLLLFRLLFGLRRPWAVDRLITTRRELILGTIDLPSAVRTVEITLLGMEARTALEEHLLTTLNQHRVVVAAEAKAHVRIDRFSQLIGRIEQRWSSLNEHDKENASERLDNEWNELKSLVDNAQRSAGRIERRMEKFYAELEKVKNEQPIALAHGTDALQSIYSYVQEQNADMFSRVEKLSQSATEVRKRRNALTEGERDAPPAAPPAL